MDLALLLVPYDSARRGERMGAGPQALVDAGIEAHLAQRGHAVRRTVVVEPPAESWRAEIRTAFDLAAGVAAAVRASRAAGRLPLVLSGNCGPAALGAAAALGAGAGVVWCDAHGDFNTPETTPGGFLDGMALATLTGRCWTALAARIPDFAPVPESRVWLLGARDLDPAEAAALDESAVRRARAAEVGATLAERIARDVGSAAPLYLHLDLDVLDAAEGRANGFAVPGGVTAAALASFCGALARRAMPAAVTLSAYDPSYDGDRRVYRAALAALDALLGEASHRAS